MRIAYLRAAALSAAAVLLLIWWAGAPDRMDSDTPVDAVREAPAPPQRGAPPEPPGVSPERPRAQEVPSASTGRDPEPSRAFVRAVLADAVDAHFPSLKLSSEEIDQLADATLRIRAAQQGLRALPVTAENVEARRALHAQLEEAIVDFEYVAEMSPAEFGAVATPPGIGIDAPSALETEDDAIVFEPLPTPVP